MISDLGRDLAYGARTLLKHKGFTAVAVFSLALGLALTATTLAVVNAYLIRSMPYPAANRLYRVIYAPQGVRNPGGMQLLDWKALGDIVEAADGSRSTLSAITEGGYTQEVMGLMASPGSLEAIGVRSIVGRSLLEEDFHPGAERVALIGQKMWQERFGADANVIGRVFRVGSITQAGPGGNYRILGGPPPWVRYVLVFGRGFVDFVLPLSTSFGNFLVRLCSGRS